jgi:UDP-N-acetylmuramoyl-L-alanyl-D-glutamate--2,6-diaminopimelate ligase
MKVVGVTGTNGKTTTAWILRDILTNLGVATGYLGTLGFQVPGESRELPNTTPFAVDLYNLLAEARDKGVQALAMEVSSHALAQKRVDGVEFDAAVFTNLTQDHLDFHGSMEEYEAAKWRLFTDLPKETGKRFAAALNVGDSVGRRWVERLRATQTGSTYTFAIVDRSGTAAEAMPGLSLEGEAAEVRVDSIHLILRERGGEEHGFRCRLGGSYNVQNLLAAVAGARCLGYSLREIAEAANGLNPVPGRFEPVPNGAGIGILVDYAHTPDALEKLLDAVRPLTSGRIVTVFGCGGDRDRGKRPLMARAASERSNLTVITSDNPRTEDPRAIVSEIESGIVPGAEAVTILDRPEAVAYAVRSARPGDVVVIAGKGHENYQIIGTEKRHFDDVEEATRALNGRTIAAA